MRTPTATYRLQCNADVRFADARALVSYLDRLGVSDLYTSPLLTARRGSRHGYDVTDPLHLNAELGTEAEFDALVRELTRHNMGLLLDIVPNHMVANSENPWWAGVLEHGPASRWAAYFDIDWRAHDGRVLLPILSGPLREVRRDIVLVLNERGLCLRYHDARLPLDPKSYRLVLERCLDGLRTAEGGGPAVRELERLIEAVERLPDRTSGDGERREREAQAIKQALQALRSGQPAVRRALDEALAGLNSQEDQFDLLLAGQGYRLAGWRTGTAEINYRRFFDVNDLAGVRVEDGEVFEATHALVLRLVDEGRVAGLRVDHIDGLYDPAAYLEHLRRSKNVYIIVEKILTGEEQLPDEWPAAGTTGYDFLSTVNGLFVDPGGLRTLQAGYAEFTGIEAAFPDVVYRKKRQVVDELFEGELRRLARDLLALAEADPVARGLTLEELADAIAQAAACFPVYRTYVRGFVVVQRDRARIERAVDEARRRSAAASEAAIDFLRRVLLLEGPPSDGRREAWLAFVMRWQQFTGPVTAKGLEDTALYSYNPLVSLNDVGADPDGPGALDVETFHRRNQARLQRSPHTLNATATHDTKRGEDVRARINVLSELAQEWTGCLRRWSALNRDRQTLVEGRRVPDPNEETLIYQTLVGAWPLDEEELPAFKERLAAYTVKAAREAKLHTSWLDPDAAHERALTEFVEAVFSSSEFLADLLPFQRKVAAYGAVNSLAQTLLKIASPGVPDVYQGTELWDFSLVDPDNRRSVDFSKRVRLLEELQRIESSPRLAQELLARWQDGRIKLYVTAKALAFRRGRAALFSDGEYLPLAASGSLREHVVAFARHSEGSWALAATPRLVAGLSDGGNPPIEPAVWGDTALSVPDDAPGRWTNVLTGEAVDVEAGAFPLGSLFAHLPVALLSAAGGRG